MAITSAFTRPLTVQTESENSAQSFRVFESSGVWFADLTATVNGAKRLLMRLRLTPIVSGSSERIRVELLDYSSSADQTFVDDRVTTPFTPAEADSVQLVGVTNALNLHAFYVAAGDATGS